MPEIRYPFKNFRYKVEFNGTEAAGFSEVSGADISVDVIEYREGNEVRTTPRKLAGLTKYGNITLKWGLTGCVLVRICRSYKKDMTNTTKGAQNECRLPSCNSKEAN